MLFLGLGYVLVSCAALAVTLLWGFEVRNQCYGQVQQQRQMARATLTSSPFFSSPIVVPEDRDCKENLDGSEAGMQIERELIRINDFLQVGPCKLCA